MQIDLSDDERIVVVAALSALRMFTSAQNATGEKAQETLATIDGIVAKLGVDPRDPKLAMGPDA